MSEPWMWEQMGLGGATWQMEFTDVEDGVMRLVDCARYLLDDQHGHHFAIVGEGTVLVCSELALGCLREGGLLPEWTPGSESGEESGEESECGESGDESGEDGDGEWQVWEQEVSSAGEEAEDEMLEPGEVWEPRPSWRTHGAMVWFHEKVRGHQVSRTETEPMTLWDGTVIGRQLLLDCSCGRSWVCR